MWNKTPQLKSAPKMIYALLMSPRKDALSRQGSAGRPPVRATSHLPGQLSCATELLWGQGGSSCTVYIRHAPALHPSTPAPTRLAGGSDDVKALVHQADMCVSSSTAHERRVLSTGERPVHAGNTSQQQGKLLHCSNNRQAYEAEEKPTQEDWLFYDSVCRERKARKGQPTGPGSR